LNLRQLQAADAKSFLKLRLLGLQESPSAFGSSYEEEKDRTIEQIEGHLEGSKERAFIGAFEEGELVGVVGVGREQGVKQRHIAFVRSMYVSPIARGNGLGRRLVIAALQRAAAWDGVLQVTLAVTASNAPAVRLYRSVGFIEIGRLPRALHHDGEYFDELSMMCDTFQ
jgi:hypothetical protein